MTTLTRLVFASSNQNKIDEIRAMLPASIQIMSLADIGCLEDIPETAETIEGNAMLKANYVTEKYGVDCFADDSGLEVEALNGAPGVHSARFAGDHRSNSDNMARLLHELSPHKNRNASFKTVIALNMRGAQNLFCGRINGTISEKPLGSAGFGYDPLFIPDGQAMTFAQMTPPEKAAMSHRARAIKQLIDFLKK